MTIVLSCRLILEVGTHWDTQGANGLIRVWFDADKLFGMLIAAKLT